MTRPRSKPVEPIVVSSVPVDEVEETPAVEETPVVEETPAVEMPKVKEVKIIKVYCTNNSLWHPFQAKYIPINPEHAVPVIEDNWLKSQMKANLVKEV